MTWLLKRFLTKRSGWKSKKNSRWSSLIQKTLNCSNSSSNLSNRKIIITKNITNTKTMINSKTMISSKMMITNRKESWFSIIIDSHSKLRNSIRIKLKPKKKIANRMHKKRNKRKCNQTILQMKIDYNIV